MKEELIKFKTAKLAKEKGLSPDEIDHDWGYVEGKLYITINISEYLLQHKKKNNYITAPTQSLLQKWLREVHDMYVDLIQTVKKRYTYNIRTAGFVSRYGEVFDTYEEALEVGLYESLKLIK